MLMKIYYQYSFPMLMERLKDISIVLQRQENWMNFWETFITRYLVYILNLTLPC